VEDQHAVGLYSFGEGFLERKNIFREKFRTRGSKFPINIYSMVRPKLMDIITSNIIIYVFDCDNNQLVVLNDISCKMVASIMVGKKPRRSTVEIE